MFDLDIHGYLIYLYLVHTRKDFLFNTKLLLTSYKLPTLIFYAFVGAEFSRRPHILNRDLSLHIKKLTTGFCLVSDFQFLDAPTIFLIDHHIILGPVVSKAFSLNGG